MDQQTFWQQLDYTYLECNQNFKLKLKVQIFQMPWCSSSSSEHTKQEREQEKTQALNLMELLRRVSTFKQRLKVQNFQPLTAFSPLHKHKTEEDNNKDTSFHLIEPPHTSTLSERRGQVNQVLLKPKPKFQHIGRHEHIVQELPHRREMNRSQVNKENIIRVVTESARDLEESDDRKRRRTRALRFPLRVQGDHRGASEGAF